MVVDVLFNNAGIMETGRFVEFDETAWDRTMAVNVRGMYGLVRAALPDAGKGRGSIVNTSSVMAYLTEPHHEAYTTSKAAVIGLTKAIAVTYAERGIRSNCICPGWVDTPMNLALADQVGGIERSNAIVKQQPPGPDGDRPGGGPGGAVFGVRRRKRDHRRGIACRRGGGIGNLVRKKVDVTSKRVPSR